MPGAAVVRTRGCAPRAPTRSAVCARSPTTRCTRPVHRRSSPTGRRPCCGWTAPSPRRAAFAPGEGAGPRAGRGRPLYLLDGPVEATEAVLTKAGLTLDDIDLFEVNEAFAAVVSWCARRRAIRKRSTSTAERSRSAIPWGAPAAGSSLSAVHELERRGGRYALVAMCAGGALATGTSSTTPGPSTPVTSTPVTATRAPAGADRLLADAVRTWARRTAGPEHPRRVLDGGESPTRRPSSPRSGSPRRTCPSRTAAGTAADLVVVAGELAAGLTTGSYFAGMLATLALAADHAGHPLAATVYADVAGGSAPGPRRRRRGGAGAGRTGRPAAARRAVAARRAGRRRRGAGPGVRSRRLGVAAPPGGRPAPPAGLRRRPADGRGHRRRPRRARPAAPAGLGASVADALGLLCAAEAAGHAGPLHHRRRGARRGAPPVRRPIGVFQAVKHRRLLVARQTVEALVWTPRGGGPAPPAGRAGRGGRRGPGPGGRGGPVLPPGAGRHRLHLGARPAPAPAPCGGATQQLAGARGRSPAGPPLPLRGAPPRKGGHR